MLFSVEWPRFSSWFVFASAVQEKGPVTLILELTLNLQQNTKHSPLSFKLADLASPPLLILR